MQSIEKCKRAKSMMPFQALQEIRSTAPGRSTGQALLNKQTMRVIKRLGCCSPLPHLNVALCYGYALRLLLPLLLGVLDMGRQSQGRLACPSFWCMCGWLSYTC